MICPYCNQQIENMKTEADLQAMWQNYWDTNRPPGIPRDPDVVYKDTGWISWANFLYHNAHQPEANFYARFGQSASHVAQEKYGFTSKRKANEWARKYVLCSFSAWCNISTDELGSGYQDVLIVRNKNGKAVSYTV